MKSKKQIKAEEQQATAWLFLPNIESHMTKKTLKAGDAVQLNTGGPTMTIDYMSKEGKYRCKWLEENGWQSAEFTPEEIRAVDRKSRNKHF